MNAQFSVKVLIPGHATGVHRTHAGAGLNNEPLRLTAVSGARYRLNDIVTLTTPAQLVMKRVGNHLHMALPGGDADWPDVIIENFFIPGLAPDSPEAPSLWGTTTPAGEWQPYKTSQLAMSPPPASAAAQATPDANANANANADSMATATEPGAESATGPTTTHLPKSPTATPQWHQPQINPIKDSTAISSAQTVEMGTPSVGITKLFESPWGMGMLAGGSLAVAALSSGGSSGSSTTTSTASIALSTLDSYAKNTSGASTPTLQTYKDAGLKLASNINNMTTSGLTDITTTSTLPGLTSAQTTSAFNSLLRNLGTAASVDAVQTGLHALFRVYTLTDGNADVGVNVHPDSSTDLNNLLAADYRALGITSFSGDSDKALLLLNDFLGSQSGTAFTDIQNTLAKAASGASAIVKWAKRQTPTESNSDLVVEMNALVGKTASTGLSLSNLNAFKTAVQATSTDASGVDTRAEINQILGLVRLQSFAQDSGTFDGSTNTKGTPTPVLDEWNNQSITANKSLTDATRTTLSKSGFWPNNANGLTALNTAVSASATLEGVTINTSLLQKMVDSYGRILQNADGSRSNETDVSQVASAASIADHSSLSSAQVVKQDLLNVGVDSNKLKTTETGDNAGNLGASCIATLASTAVDTVAELNTLAGYAQDVMNLAAGKTVTKTDAQWISQLSGLGLTGITTANISRVKAAIAATDDTGSSVDTYDEMQGLISTVRLQDYASNTAGAVTPGATDYQAEVVLAGDAYNGVVVANNVANYNAAVQTIGASSSVTSSNVYSIVKVYNSVIWSADGNRSSTTANLAETDYGQIGVTVHGSGTVTATQEATFLNQVISGLNSIAVSTPSKIQNLASIVDALAQQVSDNLAHAGGTKSSLKLTTGDQLGSLGFTTGIGSSTVVTSSYLSGTALDNFNKSITSLDYSTIQSAITGAILG
jgi:hypothetical protein